MTILALEFSAVHRSVAVVLLKEDRSADRLLAEVTDGGERSMGPLVLVDRALKEAQLDPSSVECVVVGLGPGSYTGIRSAIAVAQGWQFARGTKLLGVSSVDCMAAQAQEKRWFGTVRFVVDAQRDEFYLATYKIDPNSIELVEPLQIAKAAEVRKLGALRRDLLMDAHAGIAERTPDIIAGPEADRWFPDGYVLEPAANALARLARDRTNFVPGEELQPIYLRETQFVKAPPPRIHSIE